MCMCACTSDFTISWGTEAIPHNNVWTPTHLQTCIARITWFGTLQYTCIFHWLLQLVITAISNCQQMLLQTHTRHKCVCPHARAHTQTHAHAHARTHARTHTHTYSITMSAPTSTKLPGNTPTFPATFPSHQPSGDLTRIWQKEYDNSEPTVGVQKRYSVTLAKTWPPTYMRIVLVPSCILPWVLAHSNQHWIGICQILF